MFSRFPIIIIQSILRAEAQRVRYFISPDFPVKDVEQALRFKLPQRLLSNIQIPAIRAYELEL